MTELILHDKGLVTVRTTILTLLFMVVQNAEASELWFPPAFISGSHGVADLTRFTRGQQLPGRYEVDIYLNQRLIGRREVPFIADNRTSAKGVKDSTGLVPLLTRDELLAAGVRSSAFSASSSSNHYGRRRAALADMLPQASAFFNFQKMRLDISLPQRWIQRRPRNWTPPELWDEGITAGLLNWSFSGSRRSGETGGFSQYLQLNGGVNVGPWRLRDELSISEYAGVRTWDNQGIWAERGIPAWRSRIKLGDTTVGGRIFDSLRIRGASLSTDDEMYPDSERGYAPVIRGTALSNARISVRQRGHIVYEMNVPPGEFVIEDIDPVYSSGDLEVTVRESDGGTRLFTVPYATVPDLLRQKQTKYELSAGYVQNSGYTRYARLPLFQGTLARGMAHESTLYGGLQFSRGYQSAAFGTGFNLGAWGAISADITHAESSLSGGNHQRGQSLRFVYSRSIQQTDTTFQLAGYRYSTGGYYSLEESLYSRVQKRDSLQHSTGPQSSDLSRHAVRYGLDHHRRERMEISVSQRMTARTSLYLTGSRQTYWQRGGATTSLQAGLSTSLGRTGLSLSYSESRLPWAANDRSIYVSLSVPLNSLFHGYERPVFATVSMNRTGREYTQQTVLSGSGLEHDALSWSAGHASSQRGGDSSDLRLGYRGKNMQTSAGWSQGRGFRQVSYDASGGLIVHEGGFTAGPYLGQTSVLIETPGATGVPIAGGNGVITNDRGYAIQPWASEFRENRVAVDVTRLSAQTEIAEPVIRVVPTRGAIVRARFAARSGLRLLMTLHKNGVPLPLGTTVSFGDSASIVGENGQVYLSGAGQKGTLRARWGNSVELSCKASWDLGRTASDASVIRTSADCD